MKKALLSMIRCPACRGALSLTSQAAEGEILEGTLACSCGRAYPIRQGVPRFVSQDAYAGSFGLQWTRFSRVQLDSANGTDESRRTFYEKTGWTAEMLRGRRVLDLGCGMGRFMEVAADAGAEVIGVDLSRAVEAAWRNLGHRENVHVVQADVFGLPFEDQSFDFVFSIGVLHHTPDTQDAFMQLPRLLRAGGRISIWIYSREIKHRVLFAFSNLYRKATWRMEPESLLSICRVAAPLYHLHRVPVVGWVTRILVPTSMHPDAQWRVVDTFDWYAPRYQWKHTYDEASSWFEAAGLRNVRRLPIPVSVSGER